MIPAFPAYIFDLDGTLLDSAEDICGALHTVLADVGRAACSNEEALSYIGANLRDLFRKLFPNDPSDYIDSLMAKYREAYFARGHASTIVYPWVTGVLSALPGRKAVATSRRGETARSLLAQFGLLDYFDHVQGIDGIRYKPAPDILLACASVMGISPRDCLMVGDSLADLRCARRAGMRICMVMHGYGDQAEIRRAKPDFSITELRQLLPEG